MKSVFLYTPTFLEVPKTYKARTQVFGMGKKKAERLGEHINEHSNSGVHLVFGSAGGLKPGLEVGESFLVEKIFGHDFELKSEISMPRASLFTSESLLKSQKEKTFVHQTTQADLVDMEMGFLWQKLIPERRSQILFLRTIVDTSEDEFKWSSAIRLYRSWRVYLKAIESSLDWVMSELKKV